MKVISVQLCIAEQNSGPSERVSSGKSSAVKQGFSFAFPIIPRRLSLKGFPRRLGIKTEAAGRNCFAISSI